MSGITFCIESFETSISIFEGIYVYKAINNKKTIFLLINTQYLCKGKFLFLEHLIDYSAKFC